MGLNYTVIRRPVKYARIEISPMGEVKLVLPPGVDPEWLVERKRAWIEKKLGEIENAKKKFLPCSKMLLFNGEFYEIVEGEEFRINPKFRVVLLPGNDLKVLKKWLRNQLREELDFKVRLFSSILGVKYRRVFIRFQRTKWASCSERRNLSFNLMLMALPEELRDYVVIHELAHLRYLRHSSGFWELVGQYYPDYREAQEKLGEYWLALQYNMIWKELRRI